MSLGLNRSAYQAPVIREIRPKMMTTCDSLVGFEITDVIGLVHVAVERGFSAVSVAGLGAVEGGGLSELVEDGRFAVANLAAERGANAIVGLRFEVSGRNLEKSVLVYGTAVTCRRI